MTIMLIHWKVAKAMSHGTPRLATEGKEIISLRHYVVKNAEYTN